MTRFNPKNKKEPTIGDLLEPAMKITDQADADQYKKAYIEFTHKYMTQEQFDKGETAEGVVNSNLGYFAGYFSNETRERVERLFHCSHPVFGSIKENGSPTPEEAFEMGMALAAGKEKK